MKIPLKQLEYHYANAAIPSWNARQDSERKDKCGVIGIVSSGGSVAGDLANGLLALQHRGQESAGIATFHEGKLHLMRDMGLVSEVFARAPRGLGGSIGIGHVRYSTTGESQLCNAQPMVVKTPWLEMAIGFNGNIVNYAEHKKALEEKGVLLESTTDTEVIAHMLALEYKKSGDFLEAFAHLMRELDGAYSIVALTGRGELLAARDPTGFRPLCIGERDRPAIDGQAVGEKDIVIASETAALDAVGAKFVRYCQPGEALVLGKQNKSGIVGSAKRTAHCMFEWVYIARPDSVIEGKLVMDVRERLGSKLHALYPQLNEKIDLVVPIPDSGRSAAFGYSKASGVPIAEAIQKNRYVHRTFIMPGSERRAGAVKMKLNPVASLLKGKRVALVDDSIVRGTTMNKIVQSVRDAGALQVHLLIACPPIISPCYMGVDFPTYGELAAANGNSIESIRKQVGADSLNYMSVEGLVECIEMPKDSLCTACITGEYPLKKQPEIKA